VRLIWATRGKSWGFRFIRDGGFADPLPVYEEAFEGTEGRGEEYGRSAAVVAFRFPDPEGRRDEAGRVIPHDFVVFGPEAGDIDSVESGRDVIWPLVQDEYGRIWDQPLSTSAG
jgi:hypothetical protein